MSTLPPLVRVGEMQQASPDDVGSPAVLARAEAVIRMASTVVRAETGRSWLTAADPVTLDTATPAIDEDDLEVAKDVTITVALRVFSNPHQIVHEVTGPISRRFAEIVSQGFYLTEAERERLSRYKTTLRPALWTLSTTRLDDSAIYDLPSVFVDVTPDGEPIPYMSYEDFGVPGGPA